MASTKKDPHAVAMGRRGGKGRLRTMTKQERSESARRAVMVRHHGKPPGVLMPEKMWCVFHPTEDNPPRMLYCDTDRDRALAWARKNRPDAFIASMEPRIWDRATTRKPAGSGVGFGFHREYEPDTERQVKALKTLVEAAEGKP